MECLDRYVRHALPDGHGPLLPDGYGLLPVLPDGPVPLPVLTERLRRVRRCRVAEQVAGLVLEEQVEFLFQPGLIPSGQSCKEAGGIGAIPFGKKMSLNSANPFGFG